MRRIKLTQKEKEIEDALINGEYRSVSKKEFEEIANSLASRKKDAVLNIRVNQSDLEAIKQAAKRFKVKYQTLISELIHRVAQNIL